MAPKRPTNRAEDKRGSNPYQALQERSSSDEWFSAASEDDEDINDNYDDEDDDDEAYDNYIREMVAARNRDRLPEGKQAYDKDVEPVIYRFGSQAKKENKPPPASVDAPFMPGEPSFTSVPEHNYIQATRAPLQDSSAQPPENLPARSSTAKASSGHRNEEVVAVASRLAPRPRPAHHQKTVFDRYVKVNASEAAFRRRRPHSGVFELHKKPIEIDTDNARMANVLKRIGLKTGTFVRPPLNIEDRKLLIWGRLDPVNAAIAEIRDWIIRIENSQSTRTIAREHFSKEISTNSSRYKIANQEVERTALIHSLQQMPEPGKVFKHQGAYLWPIEDVKPQEIFGSTLEAFDPIRQQYQCHIIFVEAFKAFRIYTDDKPSSVDSVLKRIEGTLKGFHARSISGGRTWTEKLFETPRCQTDGEPVGLEAILSPRKGAQVRYVPVLTSRQPAVAASPGWHEPSLTRERSNALRIENTLRQILPSLTYYRGQLRMRILFGTFAFSARQQQFKQYMHTLPFDELVNMVEEPSTKAIMMKDLLFKEDPANVLSKIYALNNIFETPDNLTCSLDQVTRTYAVRFEVTRLDKPLAQLEVEMNSSVFAKNTYSRTHTSWSRPERKDDTIPLNIFMVRLESGSSWKFQVSTENNYDPSRIDAKMTDFEDSIKLGKGSRQEADVSGKRLFEWETQRGGSLQPSTVEQKAAWRFRLRAATSWMFEIARYDTYELLVSPKKSGKARWSTTPVATHWAACMWNVDWDIELSKNVSLGIGESADWDTSLDKFFPSGGSISRPRSDGKDPHPGVKIFLQHIRTVAEALDGIRTTSV